jgi:hypothetical protein
MNDTQNSNIKQNILTVTILIIMIAIILSIYQRNDIQTTLSIATFIIITLSISTKSIM